MHYLDYAATTPVPAEVAQAMAAVLTEHYGNPSSQYELGRRAKDLVNRSRAVVAGALGCASEQLFFTSCGTEGDNWAIRAALYQNRRVGRHIVTTAVEHSAVLQCVKRLEQEVTALLQDRPTLLHTDAVQGFLKVPFTVKTLGADYITLSAHKIGGPKGIGALYAGGRAKPPQSLLYGGGQESGLRPGTEPTAQIAGFAKAVALRLERLEETLAHLSACKSYAIEKLRAIPDLRFIGQGDAPHILSVSLPGYPSQNIVSELDAKGICISAGSACHRGKASHVLTAMGLDKKTAAGTVRVSFGPETVFEDIDALAAALLEHKTTRFPML